MGREYQDNMKEWISEVEYQKLPDFVKDAYATFCNWWASNQIPEWHVTKWSEIPKEISEAWMLIKDEGYPDFYLIVFGFNKEIGLVSSLEYFSD